MMPNQCSKGNTSIAFAETNIVLRRLLRCPPCFLCSWMGKVTTQISDPSRGPKQPDVCTAMRVSMAGKVEAFYTVATFYCSH